jgi:serine/threonine-protein kinase
MPAPSADRNLLFGILALQMDFVHKDALIAAMHAWVLAKHRPLGDILAEQCTLSPDHRQLLDALVQAHLAQHGDDAQKSLAALSSLGSARKELEQVGDADVQASLGLVAAARPKDGDPYATVGGAPPGESAVRYRVVRPHAKGGLGEVFVAEDTELGRQVALKEIQLKYADDPTNRTRFVVEAKITGGLEHPGVVPVYGLGTYADGRPFYAMRFVKGDNLHQAIKRFYGATASGGRQPPDSGEKSRVADAPRSPRYDSLDFRKLLRRFIDVCNSVAYAHGRGVLHRDLKPGNVMLGKYGETLVVDWGLAKAFAETVEVGVSEAPVKPRSAGQSTATQMGHVLGTPAYLSPEQAAGRLDQLGPATDIYSLGATLYDLLTGQAPHPAGDLDSVQKSDFPRPREVKPRVPPALEAVCLKAMARRPADRYPTALALAEDVDHWLADEPVTAWREPWGVRAWRWVRRHRTLVTAGGVGLALLAAGLGALAWQEKRAAAAITDQRDRSVEARNYTRQALDDMVSDATGESLATQKAISPEQTAFLENVLKYYKKFAAEPGEDHEGLERLARAHFRLGMIRVRLGQQDEGTAVFGRAVDLYLKLAVAFPAVPEYRQMLAASHISLGNLLGGLDKWAEAEQGYRAALALQEPLAAAFPDAPAYRDELAGSHNNLGVVLKDLGKWAEAEQAYRAALALQERLAAAFPDVPEYRQELAHSHSNLGVLLAGLGKRAEAEQAYRTGLFTLEQLAAQYPAVPGYVIELAGSFVNLGNFVRNGGDAATAVGWRAKVIERLAPIVATAPRLIMAREVLRGGHWARALDFMRLTRYDAALPDWERAIKLEDGSDRVVLRLGRAECLARLGRADDAATAAGELAHEPSADGNPLYNCACFLALAAAGPGADANAIRAVELLRRAVAKGDCDIPELLADDDLAPLRSRFDYAALLWDLAHAPLPGKQRRPESMANGEAMNGRGDGVTGTAPLAVRRVGGPPCRSGREPPYRKPARTRPVQSGRRRRWRSAGRSTPRPSTPR